MRTQDQTSTSGPADQVDGHDPLYQRGYQDGLAALRPLVELVAEMERNLRSDVVRWTENANLPARQWADRARAILASQVSQ